MTLLLGAALAASGCGLHAGDDQPEHQLSSLVAQIPRFDTSQRSITQLDQLLEQHDYKSVSCSKQSAHEIACDAISPDGHHEGLAFSTDSKGIGWTKYG